MLGYRRYSEGSELLSGSGLSTLQVAGTVLGTASGDEAQQGKQGCLGLPCICCRVRGEAPCRMCALLSVR